MLGPQRAAARRAASSAVVTSAEAMAQRVNLSFGLCGQRKGERLDFWGRDETRCAV